MLDTILYATFTMFGLALVFCIGLVIANVKLAVFVDPVQAKIERALPGANCGNCGYAGCAPYAKAVFEGKAAVNLCTVGGPSVTQQIADALGVEAGETFPMKAVVFCGARSQDRKGRGNYQGEQTCTASNVVGGVQGCTAGCLGFGDCVLTCEYDAMKMVDGLPEINIDNCVGCGACVRACPRSIIRLVPFKSETMTVVACSNHDPAKATREVCAVGCIACKACERIVPEVFTMADNLAVIDYDKYKLDADYQATVDKCPMDTIVFRGEQPPRKEPAPVGVEENGAKG